MAQSGSVWKKWVTLTDMGDSLGSKMFSGSPIYAYVNTFGMGGKINYGYDPIIMPGTDFIGSNIGSSFRDGIAYNSYTGYETPTLSLSGNWTTDLGSYQDGGGHILTPYKILVMAHSGRRFYLKDERIIEQMIIESGSSLFTETGIPVVILDYNFDYTSANLNNTGWTLKLRQDRV